MVCNAPEIAPLVEANIVVLGRLHELGLIHDVSDLFFKETVGHGTHLSLVVGIVSAARH